MTSPMNLPLYGEIKLYETSKQELLRLWQSALGRNNISITENSKVESIKSADEILEVITVSGHKYTSSKILLSIGRRGSPRKLNVPGEINEKVAYRLLEPELISGKHILVVGGGDSAVESALLLADRNNVTLSYRNEAFSRLKPSNNVLLTNAVDTGKLKVMLKTNVISIEDETVTLTQSEDSSNITLQNELVYIFAGGELPTQFLEKAGIRITKKFGETIMKHT